MENNKKTALVAKLNEEMQLQTSDPAVMRALLATSFKGFKDEKQVKQAILEAMINGYSFQDIIKKKVYAIPFGNGYSLVESIGSVRATAMRSGQVGKSAPVFVDDDKGNIITCSVTVKRAIIGVIGEYTATVYFKEYNKGKDNWKNKPRTMIAKVAEMHALRMAFPEELEAVYIEDEFNNEETIEYRANEAKEEAKSLIMGNFVKDNDKNNEEETNSETTDNSKAS